MRITPNDIQNLKLGTVIRDNNFVFQDGEIKAKYFIILSDIIKDNYIYTLTTSKTDTYRSSIHDECVISDPVFPLKTIIEIRRASFISTKKLINKIGDLENMGILTKINLEYILEMISESDFVPGYVKDIIIDIICEE